MKINIKQIFQDLSDYEFENLALKIFEFQAVNNDVYKNFLNHLKIIPASVKTIEDIPFIPIEFFKSHLVVSTESPYDLIFKSSGTTGTKRSEHYVKYKQIYEKSFFVTFNKFFGNINEYVILALLPSYIEQGNSSLVYMIQKLIEATQSHHSGFFLYEHQKLAEKLLYLDKRNKKILLFGVSYALLDFVKKYQFNLKNTIIIETGGMKGRKKEMVREELHNILKKSFGVDKIFSEYGMTELLSQSYSKGDGIFHTPPWKKIMIRDTEDPFTYLKNGKIGGINIIDLANIYSCSFIATQDMGKKINNETFTIEGRFDNSDIRGCNLLVV